MQNGNPECIDNYDLLPAASIIEPLYAQESGYLKKIKTYEVAVACKILGAGREKKTDAIDYAVGVVLNKKVGEKIEKGEKLLDIYANSQEKLKEAEKMLQEAFVIVDEKTEPEPLIYKIID